MPPRTAVLVIDVQQGLCDGERHAVGAPKVIERINAVTAAARDAGVPVVMIQHDAAEPDDLLYPTQPGWRLADALHVAPIDLRLRKRTPDAFEHTGLDALLRGQGVDTLVVCGMQTQFCVDTTTRRALALGYPVTLVADGHTTGGDGELTAAQVMAHHNLTLSQIESFGPRATPVLARDIRFETFVPAEADIGGDADAEAVAIAVVQRQLDAYNARDIEAWLGTYASDAAQFDLHGNCLARGHDQMRARMVPRFAEPDLHATLTARHAIALPRNAGGGVLVTDHERVRRCLDSRVVDVPMVCLYEVRHGRIARATFALGAPV